MDVRQALRRYRRLLRLLPPGVRRSRGEEMERLFADMWREHFVGGSPPSFAFWFGAVSDVLSTAAAVRATRLIRSMRGGLRRQPGDLMTSLLSDLRFGVRQILLRPLFSGVIILLVAVGIAGNAAVFRIFNGLFIQPLPFQEAERLVNIDVTAPAWDLEYVNVSIGDFRVWERENRTFESMAVYTVMGGNLATDESAYRVTALNATHQLDDVLALQPALGRFFTEEEDRPDAPLVALLSQEFWASQFGSDPGVLGRILRVNGQPVEVIGVLPEEARFVGEADLWTPLREDDDSSFYLTGVGRLRPDATIDQALSDLTALHRAMIPDRSVNEITSPVIASLRDRYLGDARLGSGILLAAVAIVLLIACGNIAGLMFARSVARMGEMSVRQALGASRRRIVRQVLTENFLLAGFGALLGAWLGIQAAGKLTAVLSDQFPPWVTFTLDLPFLAFVIAITAGTALISGVAPALGSSRARIATGSAGRVTGTARVRRLLQLLVAGEVALAATLLVVAGLAVVDLRGLTTVDPGFRSQDLLTYMVQLPPEQYPEAEDRLQFTEAYLEGLRSIPGVEDAMVASNLPLMGHSGWFFEVEGRTQDDESDPVVLRRWVSPGYMKAVGVSLIEGRAFDDFDGREDGGQVAVVNEAFVRTHLGEFEDPVGQRIRTNGDNPWITVVGVARNVLHYGAAEEMRPGIYEPLPQNPPSYLQVGVRVPVEGEARAGVLSAIRDATAAMDPELPLFDLQWMQERLDESLLTRRATSLLIASFSVVALLLSVAGLYGVISFAVGQRNREISIRLALGAEPGQVQAQVVRQGLIIVALGLGAGLSAAMAAGSLVAGILVGVSPRDPWVFLGVSGLILLVATGANLLPARRAARLDPMEALRRE